MQKTSVQSIIKKQIADKRMSHVYLLFGEEEFLRDEYAVRVQNALCGGDSLGLNTLIYSENINTADIDDAFETYPMLSDTKFILIKDSNIFAASKNEDDNTVLRDYWKKRLSDVPSYLYLVFVEKNVDKRSALYKLINKSYTAAEFTRMTQGELTTWIERKMLKNGRKIAKKDAVYISMLCSNNLMAINAECDKLINYTDTTVHRDDIDKLTPKSLEIRIFDITDGIMERNADKVLRTLYDLNAQNTSAFQILYILSGAFDKMLQCRLMLDMSYPVKSIAEKLSLPEFIVKKYIAGAEHFSTDFLERMIINTAYVDFSVKQGRQDERSALEDYVIDALKQFKKY